MTWRVDGDGEGRDFGRERVFVNVCVGGGVGGGCEER